MRKFSINAFTLVEVTLALGLTAFCMISLLSLLPVGLNTNLNSVEQTAAAGVVNTVFADIRTQAAANAHLPSSAAAGKSPQYGFDLTAVTAAAMPTTQTVFINQDGSSTKVGTPAPITAIYRVSVNLIAPTAAQPATATPLRVLVTWPALPINTSSGALPKPMANSGSFEAATAVDLTR